VTVEDDSPRVSLEPAADGVSWLTLDRRATRNALDWQMLEAFHAAIDEAEASATTRVVLVRSALQGVFVAGGDIAVMRDLQLIDGSRFVYAGQRALRRLEESRLVFVAVVGGYALGGGLELALACDLVVASESAVFGFPETRLGLLPGWGGTQRIVRAISPQRARELVYTGRRIDAAEAYEYGFLNRVVAADELEPAALELAAAVTKSSPTGVSQSKRALVHGSRVSLDQGLVIEAEAWLANLSSPNRVEGLSAFLEKREPRFTAE
jgi:enoyl-CoA hydratase/carnithine racemase